MTAGTEGLFAKDYMPWLHIASDEDSYRISEESYASGKYAEYGEWSYAPRDSETLSAHHEGRDNAPWVREIEDNLWVRYSTLLNFPSDWVYAPRWVNVGDCYPWKHVDENGVVFRVRIYPQEHGGKVTPLAEETDG